MAAAPGMGRLTSLHQGKKSATGTGIANNSSYPGDIGGLFSA